MVEQSLRKGKVGGSTPLPGSKIMTTYKSHRQKNISKKIRTYVIILFLLIIFFFTIGIKILINTSLFISGIANRGKSTTEETKDKNDFLPEPEIYNLPNATNSASLIIEGRGLKNKKISIFLNDSKEKEIILKEDEFASDINIKEGENEIYLVLKDSINNKEKESKKYQITLIKKPPTLEILSPTNGTKTNKNEIVISGQTDVGVNVKIGNDPVVADSMGKFNHNINLQEGENTIKITAVDIALNSTDTEIKVIYEKD